MFLGGGPYYYTILIFTCTDILIYMLQVLVFFLMNELRVCMELTVCLDSLETY